MICDMKKVGKSALLLFAVIVFALPLSSCSEKVSEPPVPVVEDKVSSAVSGAVDFVHELDSYEPKKDTYNFYFTYKIVHPW